MSGAFDELAEITKKRIVNQGIGFGASVKSHSESLDYLKYTRPEDLIRFGFETEFIGRLPVISLFEKLSEDDLFAILKNPNNPVILSKKLDFRAYGIDVKFDDRALRALAQLAYQEGTGARALVSVIEKVLVKLEKRLPSTDIKKLPVTEKVVKDPEGALQEIVSKANSAKWERLYEKIVQDEKDSIKKYVQAYQAVLTDRYDMVLTRSRRSLIADVYAMSTFDMNAAMEKISRDYDQIKNIQDYFSETHDLDVTLAEDAIDVVIGQMKASQTGLRNFYKKLTSDFEDGFQLIRDRTGKSNFVVTKEALEDPEQFLNDLVKEMYTKDRAPGDESQDS
jgi:ribosomal protein L14E/L6E/L27E